ncbi:MAG TPA: hypothetical protein VHM90_07210 [Phycisphaerae bacterium]|nr:hypothetical protein [Phycisphaerae bacterium]
MELTRRDALKIGAAAGLATVAAGFPQPALAMTQPSPPARKAPPTVGIAMGPAPLARENLDLLFEDMKRRAGVNVLMPFIYTYVARTASLPAAGFRGGNFAMPHMQYYKNTTLTFDEMRAPEFKDVDVFERTIPIAQKHGIKTYAWILEDNVGSPFPSWSKMYEIDFHGRRAEAHPAGPCYNNPQYLGFVLGLVEDYCRSYDVEGLMWSSERQGGLFNALGAYHNGARADPGQATCFCEFCAKRGKDQGIDVERAKKGFAALEQFVRDGRARRAPRDGYFVTFFRLLLNYPELLAWESLWIKSRQDMQRQIYKLVKSIKPIPVGWHIWHNVSFSPFHRAEMDFTQYAEFSDFIKPVLYSNVAGDRIRSFTDSITGNVFGDLPRPEAMAMLQHMLNYNEAPYERVLATGLSADYVERETRRTADDAGPKVAILPGIDIDVPVPAGASRCTPESVKASVLAAFKGGAAGVILSRNYTEMTPENLAGAGMALKELGYL